MTFQSQRLIYLRQSLGISKAEAARRLNISAMGYGRYENGDRQPSFQSVSYIAQIFGTTTDYLYGLSENPKAESITVTAQTEPELFRLVEDMRRYPQMLHRVLAYAEKLSAK